MRPLCLLAISRFVHKTHTAKKVHHFWGTHFFLTTHETALDLSSPDGESSRTVNDPDGRSSRTVDHPDGQLPRWTPSHAPTPTETSPSRSRSTPYHLSSRVNRMRSTRFLVPRNLLSRIEYDMIFTIPVAVADRALKMTGCTLRAAGFWMLEVEANFRVQRSRS